MNLHSLLAARESDRRPVRAVLIGAGKFGSMYLAQARRTAGLRILAVADLAPERARAALARVGWSAERYAAKSLEEAARGRPSSPTTPGAPSPTPDQWSTQTGSPAGIAHALECCGW
jgi:threonine dehydrogenase-like Zn-dependent dehydrogenase